MKACQAHWDELKAALEERGLEKFIAKTGSEVATRVVGAGGTERDNFEPLIGAYMAITNNALRVLGLSLLAPQDDGTELCPLCALIDPCGCGRGEECHFRKYIAHAADEQVEHARQLGLLPRPV